MPCHVDPADYGYSSKVAVANQEEADELTKQFKAVGDEAYSANDLLREYLLGNIGEQKILPLLNQKLEDKFFELNRIDSAGRRMVERTVVEKVRQLVKEYEDLNEKITLRGRERLTVKQKVSIEHRQMAHREEDLRRLMKTFAEVGDRKKLQAVIDADVAKPLAEQLGFEPDEF